MKNLITILLIITSFNMSSQKWINDSNCDEQSYEILNEAITHLANIEQLTAVGMAKAAKMSDSGCECANLVLLQQLPNQIGDQEKKTRWKLILNY